jgi:hypothetical protein
MGKAQHRQRNLFEEEKRVVEPLPELRAKLTSLLQTLLAEAACIEQCEGTRGNQGGEETGDDQDCA